MRRLPTAHRTTTHRRAVIAVLAAALGVALVTGCSASGTSQNDSAGGAAQSDSAGAGDERAPADSAPEAQKAADGTTSSGSVSAAQLDRKLTRRADMSIVVASVPKAASDIRSIATAAKGLVVSEQLSAPLPPARDDVAEPSHAQEFSTMTISVPASALDATLDRLAALGTVDSRATSTDDVTSTYVDTASRIKTMRASVDRVRALMSRADKIGDIVTLESELSRREADLESLEQRLATLDDAVAMSPIEIRLTTEGAPVDEPPTGFLGGLAAGWDAFTASVAFLLTALGAVLPFAVVFALVGVPLWLRLRRRRVTAPPAAPPPAQA